MASEIGLAYNLNNKVKINKIFIIIIIKPIAIPLGVEVSHLLNNHKLILTIYYK